jgi:hypothetical protein
MIDRLIVALDVLLHGPPSPPDRRGNDRAYLPAESPLATEEGHAARTEAALRMMDEDCYGFLLFTLHRESVGVCAEIRMADYLHPTWWPAVAEALDRVSYVERTERPS